MNLSKLLPILIGAAVAILGATGLVTPEEGSSLQGHCSSIALGIIGVAEIVKGVRARRKGNALPEAQTSPGD